MTSVNAHKFCMWVWWQWNSLYIVYLYCTYICVYLLLLCYFFFFNNKRWFSAIVACYALVVNGKLLKSTEELLLFLYVCSCFWFVCCWFDTFCCSFCIFSVCIHLLSNHHQYPATVAGFAVVVVIMYYAVNTKALQVCFYFGNNSNNKEKLRTSDTW